MTSAHLRRSAGIGITILLASIAFCTPRTSAARAPDAGRVLADTVPSDHLDAETSAAIQRRLDASVRELARQGLLPAAAPRAGTPGGLGFPMKPYRRDAAWANWATSFFVDHDPANPNQLRDYACGQRTYDMVGYNHGGTDYVPWPFPWWTMDQAGLRIVAAAAGVVVLRQDGNFDRNCTFRDGDPPVNAVFVRQDDGLTAWYLHLKRGSVGVELGERVEAGDYLGLVGSSGRSSVPHLHFELRDATGRVVDPRHGECNAGPERWAEVQLYEDPRLTTLTTHSAEPAGVACGVVGGEPVHEATYFRDRFQPGDELWVLASWGDHRNGQLTSFTIRRPDASVFADWTFDLASAGNPQPFYSGTAYAWQYTLPANAPQGTWSVRAEFLGQAREHRFTVGDLVFRDRETARPDSRGGRAAAGHAELAHCRPGRAGDCPPR